VVDCNVIVYVCSCLPLSSEHVMRLGKRFEQRPARSVHLLKRFVVQHIQILGDRAVQLVRPKKVMLRITPSLRYPSFEIVGTHISADTAKNSRGLQVKSTHDLRLCVILGPTICVVARS